MNQNSKIDFSSFKKGVIGDRKYLSELSFEEIYSLIEYIVSIEFSRNSQISKIYTKEDLTQDIALVMLRDHETENMKPVKCNIKSYIAKNMTINHFCNVIFYSAMQYASIEVNRKQGNIGLLQSASLDAELEDEKSCLYDLVAKKPDSKLDYQDILDRIPNFGNNKYYIRIVQKNGEVLKLKYTYKNVMRLFIYLYNRGEEHKIRRFIYEVETNKAVKDVDKVLRGFRLCMSDYNVLSEY